MLTESGQTKVEGHIRPFVLSFGTSEKGTEKGFQGEKAITAGGVPIEQRYGFSRGYPFFAPSVKSLWAHSTNVLRMKPSTAAPKTRDPWVLRCRIAAAISGILLLIALVTAIVVVGKYQ